MNTVVDTKKFEPKIPAAVAALAAKATDLQEKFINPEPPTDPNKPVEPPAPSAAPTMSSAEPSAPPAESPAPLSDDEKSWQHRYLSMKGRYDSDVPKLKAQINALSEQITNLNNVLSTVNNKPEPAPAAAPVTVKSLITPEEAAEYGDDFIDFASRLASQEVARATQPLQRELEQLRAQVGSVGQNLHQNARARLFASMDESIPNWREINQTDEFLDWLKLTDPFSGAIRHQLLNDAVEQNNFPRVSSFFKGFLAELAATVAPAGAEPEVPAAPPQKPSLEAFVAPGRAKAAAATPPSAPTAKRIITSTQISAFYRDKAAGKYRGREAEANSLEADIFEAQREGRIQN